MNDDAVPISPPRSPKSGERLYAIGDMHGREDLFKKLVNSIKEDDVGRPRALTKLIVLGDFIDRGPDSKLLVERLMRYTQATDRFIVLRGNHEQLMLSALEGDHKAFATWLKIGGARTLASWGVSADLLAGGSSLGLLRAVKRAISEDVLAWLRARPLWHLSGDVLFVHAGLRPGTSLGLQEPDDLLWGCREFFRSDTPHPFLVVHGDSMDEAGPNRRAHRIGIDTGAYLSERLTAVGLEADQCWFLST